MRARLTVLVAGLLATLAALPAAATPQSDFDAVYADWKADRVVSQCRWTQQQLQNAYDVASSNPDFQYETGFQDAVRQEINRWKAGGCRGVAPSKQMKSSPLTGARIVAVSGRGGARSEVVKIRNGARKPLAFRKARIRNAKAGRLTFPARFRLAKGKTATVRVACQRGKRRASFRGRTVWLCSRRQLFRDRGDIAKLADIKGVVVSQRGFGSQQRRPVF